MTQPKIAFVWSGQTREMSKLPEQNADTLRAHELISQGFDVDHFGHTWSDQEEPYNSYKMKSWRKTDQQDIVNWAMDNYNRIMFHHGWTSEPMWQNLSRHQQFDRVLELQKPIWGQIWSFLEGLQLIGEKHIFDYDYIIKTRYDTAFFNMSHQPTSGFADESDWNESTACKKYNQQLHFLLQPNGLHCPESCAIVSHDGWGGNHGGFIQDHVIVFRGGKNIRALVADPPGKTLDRFIKNVQASHYQHGRASHYWESMTHSLWYQFITYNGMHINYSLPSIFSRNSNNYMQIKDYNIESDQ